MMTEVGDQGDRGCSDGSLSSKTGFDGDLDGRHSRLQNQTAVCFAPQKNIHCTHTFTHGPRDRV